MTGGTHDPVALRVQRLDLQLQTLVLGQLTASRSEGAAFTPAAVLQLFHDFGLPAPAKVANVFTALTKKKWFSKQPQRAATDAAIEAGFVLLDDRDAVLAEARPDLVGAH